MKTDVIIIVNMKIAYEVNCIRTDNEAALDELLSGKKKDEVSAAKFMIFETLPPPNGNPLPDDDLGYPAIATFDEACSVAKASLQNSQSIPRKYGFAVDTPIYLHHENAPAELLNLNDRL